MLIWLLVLFAALSPGVLFTMPSLGKKLRGKVIIAAMHAVLFVIVVRLLRVNEGFGLVFNVPTFSAADMAKINARNDAEKQRLAAAEAAKKNTPAYIAAQKREAELAAAAAARKRSEDAAKAALAAEAERLRKVSEALNAEAAAKAAARAAAAAAAASPENKMRAEMVLKLKQAAEQEAREIQQAKRYGWGGIFR